MAKLKNGSIYFVVIWYCAYWDGVELRFLNKMENTKPKVEKSDRSKGEVKSPEEEEEAKKKVIENDTKNEISLASATDEVDAKTVKTGKENAFDELVRII